MSFFNILALLLTLSALFSYINHRYFHLPTTIGVMLIALGMSAGIIALDSLGLDYEQQARVLLHRIDFNKTVLHGMLSFLLFAAALHVSLNDLTQYKRAVTLLATVAVVISTVVVGLLSWYVLGLLGIHLALVYCLLFGALISPTDPIAVLGLLKQAGVPHSLEMKITGEALFNDGVAVVLFLALLGMVTGEQQATVAQLSWLFAKEAVGGLVFGLVLGWLAYRALKGVDQHQVQVLITLAVVTEGYALADRWHISGPIAITVAGLVIGNHARQFAISALARERLDGFWELMDGILNAVLFVLLGLEVLALAFTKDHLLAAMIAIPIVLVARFVSIAVPLLFTQSPRRIDLRELKMLTWCGLRGGISVALALSLPVGAARDLVVAITYAVVAFSILVQGLTLGRLARKR